MTSDQTNEASSMPPWYFLRWSHALGALILCGICVFLSVVVLWHTDVWGHALYGRWILDHRSFPDKEPFTPYSDPNETLVQSQWLSQVIYAWVIDAGGRWARGNDPVRMLEGRAELLLSLHHAVLVAMYLFLWLAYRRISGSSGWANFALILVFAALVGATTQRPQMIGMLCFSILLFVLSRPQTSRAAVVGVPILMVMWANLHGSFVVGFVLLGVVVLSRFMHLRFTKRPHPIADLSAQQEAQAPSSESHSWRSAATDPQVLRPLLALLISIVAVACLNPHGPKLYWLIATFSSRPNLQQLNEWRPTELRSGGPGFWPYVVSWLLVVVTFSLSSGGRGWVFVTALPFGLMPLLQHRMQVWWLPLACWFVAANGPILARRLGVVAWIPSLPRNFMATFLIGIFVLGAVLLSPPLQWLWRGQPRTLDRTLSAATCWQLGLELNAEPKHRGRWLPKFAEVTRTYPEGRFSGSVYATETLGDYVLTVAPAEAPVLLYSHAHVFSPAHFQACMDAKFAVGNWRQWFIDNRVNLVVIEPDLYAKLAGHLRKDPEWQVVIDDSGSSKGAGNPFNRKLIAIRRKPLQVRNDTSDSER